MKRFITRFLTVSLAIIFAVLAFVNNKDIDTNKNNVIERNNNNEHNNDIVS